MKYRTVNDGEEGDEFIVLTEDGGCVAVHHNGDNNVSTYYQNRLTDITNPSKVWDELAEGKVYYNDWADESVETITQDALNWLVFPPPDKWVKDESIFNNTNFPWESQ